MMTAPLLKASVLVASLASSVFAQTLAPSPTAGCTFDSLTNPACWDGEFDLTTDWYEETPDTGRVVEYWFDLVEGIIAPDGVERYGMTVNGSVPGPTVEANWGDTVVIHVTNQMLTNGTSIHWHGIRQYLTNAEDGVASITQCPTAPGETMTYRWRATQYGTSWYHSHFSLQAYNGVFGPIVINGPASSPYDVDVGPVMVSDWYHAGLDSLWDDAQENGVPDTPNGLINGLNVYEDGGERWETVFEAGKTYRFRLINPSIDTIFRVMLDGHNMTVIAADLVPIEPYVTDTVNIAIGQRYDVLFTADQDETDYWFRAIPQTDCSTTNLSQDNIRGIVRYDSASTADPVTTETEYTDTCDDEALGSLIPYVALDAGDKTAEQTLTVGITFISTHLRWTIDGATFVSDWGYTTVEQIIDGDPVYEDTQNVIELPTANQWYYWIVQNTLGAAHPIHLHGHDFYVLGQEDTATYEEGVTELNLSNPMRRDVAMLPANGYLAIGFYTDNPGVWLMHCHIGWHASQGFALQLVERSDEIPALYAEGYTGAALADTCTAWNEWELAEDVDQSDHSGI